MRLENGAINALLLLGHPITLRLWWLDVVTFRWTSVADCTVRTLAIFMMSVHVSFTKTIIVRSICLIYVTSLFVRRLAAAHLQMKILNL